MRETFFLNGPKKYVESIAAAAELVAEQWPLTRREGSVGHWVWLIGDDVVAEAWLAARKPGWWLRVLSSQQEKRGS